MKNQPKKKKVCRYGIKIYCISDWSLNHNDSVKLHGSGLFVKTTKYLYMQSKITNYYTCIKKKSEYCHNWYSIFGTFDSSLSKMGWREMHPQ